MKKQIFKALALVSLSVSGLGLGFTAANSNLTAQAATYKSVPKALQGKWSDKAGKFELNFTSSKFTFTGFSGKKVLGSYKYAFSNKTFSVSTYKSGYYKIDNPKLKGDSSSTFYLKPSTLKGKKVLLEIFPFTGSNKVYNTYYLK